MPFRGFTSIQEMKTLKAILRTLCLIFLILIALSGIGFIGAIFNTRERFRDKEIRIEMVDKQKDESETEQTDQIQVKN